MDKPITQEDISGILEIENKEENFDLTIPVDIENFYRIEDMEEGDVIVLTIKLLKGSRIKKECQIIDSQELLLSTEEDEIIQLRYDDNYDKYYMVSSE